MNTRWIVVTAAALIAATAAVWLALSLTEPAGPADPPSAADDSDHGALRAAAGNDGAERRSLAEAGAVAPGMVRVVGRVIDPWGEPVSGALVGDAVSDRPTRTADDGVFTLVAARGDGSLALLTLADRYPPLLSSHELGEPGHRLEIGDVQLLRGATLMGSVIDAGHSPIAGAAVSLSPSSRGVWPPSIDVEALFPSTATGADGTYHFARIPPGSYRVTASAPETQIGRSNVIAVEDGTTATVAPITLDVGHRLHGIVLDTRDRPVVGAAIRLRNGPGQARLDQRVESGDDGRFACASLPPGPLLLEVSKAGFLRHRQEDVDPTSGRELVVRLPDGLRIEGTVVDRGTGRPVVRFAASLHRIGEVDPTTNGTMAQQLKRQIEQLRIGAAADTDADSRDRRLRLWTELGQRLERMQARADSGAVVVPDDPGTVEEHVAGAFAFDGLEEGSYAVGIASPDHRFAVREPVDVARDRPVPSLRFELEPGHAVDGTVVAASDGEAVPGARVELVRLHRDVAGERDGTRSLYPWLFAPAGASGVTVMATRTGGDGRFAFRNAHPGRYRLAVRHPKLADHETEPFEVTATARHVRLAVPSRATLTGRVVGAPPGQEGGIEVLVLGGHGTMRTVHAGADGTYRIEDLQPGDYLVRAFPSRVARHVDRLFGSIFPLHAGAVDPDRIPPSDVTLLAGEVRTFDAAVDLPPCGEVAGTVTINGQPAASGRVVLRPLPNEAPGAGGLALRGECDASGAFAVPDVPLGRYALTAYGDTRQELHRQDVEVAAAAARVQVDVAIAAGGLRGRVWAADAGIEDMRGYLWVLPGAAEAPADLYAYRRSGRTHRVRVRDGAFEDACLTPGPAIVVVDIRGRQPATTTVRVPDGGVVELDLQAGPASR